MMVFHKERLVYLAIPKTGTSAIERALGGRASALFRDPPGLKHTNARGFERKFRAMFQRGGGPALETCAVMREPIDWLGSWYRYRQRPALKGHQNSTADVSFDAFVNAYLSDAPPPFAKLGSQGRFVTGENGKLLINHLFQYEQIGNFHDFLHRKLGVRVEPKRVNVSPKIGTSLSPEVEQKLRTQHRLDFDIHAALKDGPLSMV